MRSRLTTFLAAPILALLLAACSGPRLAKPDAGDAACHGKDPAAEARGTQGVSAAHPFNPYVGKDSYANVALDAGTVLYSLTPGAPPGFAVPEETLREAGGSQARYYALVQVSLEPGKDEQGRPRSLRDRLRAFHVLERLCAARGVALANPQFGSGGGIQYYVSPSDLNKLRPADIAPISRWSPGIYP